MPLLLMILAALAVAPADTTVTVTADHYRVYDSEGNPASIEAIVEALTDLDVLFIGETHDDPVVHYLERELLEQAFLTQHERGVSLSMEMFSRDVQHVVDEYLADLITESHFTAASNPWINYSTDYRPMVEFARIHKVPVVAANAPRRYVNRVTRLGPTSLLDLPDYTRAFLAPLPFAPASEAYRAEWDALMEEAMEEMRAAADSATEEVAERAMPVAAVRPEEPPPGHPGTGDGDEPADPEGNDMEGDMPADSTGMMAAGGPVHGGMSYMLDSQSLWDATMAYSVAQSLLARPGGLVVHVVGAFHVENGTGIPEQLKRYRPGVRQIVVTVRPVEDLAAFDPDEHAGLGDFVILADESLPRTHQR